MPSRAEVTRLANAHKRVATLADRDLRALLARLPLADNPAAALRALEEVLPALVARYGDMSASVAAEWFEQNYDLPATMPPYLSDEGIVVSTRWAAAPARAGAAVEAQKRLSYIVNRAVTQMGRDAMIDSSATAGLRWARVPVGETCAFCLMLASRGFDYRSRESAGGAARKFHAYDDCQVVPDDGDPPAGYDPDGLYERYQAARDEAGSGRTKSILSAMREIEDIH